MADIQANVMHEIKWCSVNLQMHFEGEDFTLL